MIVRKTYFLIYFLALLEGATSTLLSQSKYLRTYTINNITSLESSLPPSNSISHINLASSGFWIGTSKGVAKSLDFGRSWTSYRDNPKFANDGIFSIATAGDVVWTATGFDKTTSDGTVQTGSGYTYSTDGGLSWNHRPQTLDPRNDSILVYGINDSLRFLPIVVPEQNVTFDIALSPGTVWIASWASGLRKTTDDGAKWQRIPLPPDNRSSLKQTDTLWSYASSDTAHLHRIFPRFDPRRNNNFLAFSVFTEDGDTIWCGTAGGVNKSMDGGQSWEKFNHQNQASPILGNWVIAISQQHLEDRNRIWTTNWKAEDPSEDYGVSYTDDGGQTWKNLLHGIKAYGFAFKNEIAYIATDQGIFRTSDGGSTFNNVTSITNPSHNEIVAFSSIYAIAVANDSVFVGTADGLASTIDNANHRFGESWTIHRAFQAVGPSSAVYAYPNPFSPRLQIVRIHYGESPAPSTTRSVSIDIFDFGMNRIRTLINGAQRSGASEYDEVWDGRRDDGTMAASGVYIYRVTIDDGESHYGKILVLQ